jgi:hypothetical protein
VYDGDLRGSRCVITNRISGWPAPVPPMELVRSLEQPEFRWPLRPGSLRPAVIFVGVGWSAAPPLVATGGYRREAMQISVLCRVDLECGKRQRTSPRMDEQGGVSLPSATGRHRRLLQPRGTGIAVQKACPPARLYRFGAAR